MITSSVWNHFTMAKRAQLVELGNVKRYRDLQEIESPTYI